MPPKKDQNSNYKEQNDLSTVIMKINSSNEMSHADFSTLETSSPKPNEDSSTNGASQDSEKFSRESQFKIRIMEMEGILRERIKELQKDDIQLNGYIVQDMAKQIFDQLKTRDINEGLAEKKDDEFEDFVPSNGWVERFKIRSKYYFAIQAREKVKYERMQINSFLKVFQEHIRKGEYLPEQVFSADVTKLFWKRLPDTMFIFKDGTDEWKNDAMSRISLMLASNATGDFKIEPMLIYHDDNLEVFTKNVISSDDMGVYWRCNKEIRMTKLDFIAWLAEIFCPSVNMYMNTNKMEKKILLLLNSTQGYGPNIESEIKKIYPFIDVIMISKEISHYVHPIDSQVIDMFRRLYTRDMFHLCYAAVKKSQLENIEALKKFWKLEFHIFQAIDIIVSVWDSISSDFLNAAWGVIWPEIQRTMPDLDDAIVLASEITAVGQVMGINTSYNDVEKLMEIHDTPVSNTELQQLNIKSTQRSRSVPTDLLEECLDAWNVFEKILPFHPSIGVDSYLVQKFKLIVTYFKRLLRDRKTKEAREQQMLAEREAAKRLKIEASSDFDLMDLPPGTSNTYFTFE